MTISDPQIVELIKLYAFSEALKGNAIETDPAELVSGMQRTQEYLADPSQAQDIGTFIETRRVNHLLGDFRVTTEGPLTILVPWGDQFYRVNKSYSKAAGWFPKKFFDLSYMPLLGFEAAGHGILVEGRTKYAYSQYDAQESVVYTIIWDGPIDEYTPRMVRFLDIDLTKFDDWMPYLHNVLRIDQALDLRVKGMSHDPVLLKTICNFVAVMNLSCPLWDIPHKLFH